MKTVRKHLTEKDLARVRAFLAPEPDGRGFFENFVIENPLGEPWGIQGSEGHLEGRTTARRLFDLWQLVATVLPEAAGVNRNHILFEPDQPVAEEALSPDKIEMPRAVFYEIADQLRAVVRSLDARIPIVNNGAVFMETLPRFSVPKGRGKTRQPH